MMNLFIDRKYRLPRVWSNEEIKKFAMLFSGDIVNVSGWKDKDKAGRHYRDYFKNAATYTITNYEAKMKGFQGNEGEILLDLAHDPPSGLVGRFDVVFNHTTLEHIYDFSAAFKNLCSLTKDVVMIVVPFLQEMHGTYGDYWRFSPSAVKNLFEENGLTLLYLSFNNHKNASVYVFAIASKNAAKWESKIHNEFSYRGDRSTYDCDKNYIGSYAVQNTRYCLKALLKRCRKKFRGFLRKKRK